MTGSGELSCRAVLFDLDGVLVRSGAVVERSWTEWARDRGLEPARVLAACHGRRSVEVIAAIAPHLDAAAEAARLEARQAADTDGLTRCRGADAVLAALSGAAWAVVTSGTSALARSRLRATGLPVPDVLVTADDVTSGKPAPDGYLAASRALGVPPADCVVVEDALPGVTAARAAGMTVVGVRGPALGPEESPARVIGAVGDLAPGSARDASSCWAAPDGRAPALRTPRTTRPTPHEHARRRRHERRFARRRPGDRGNRRHRPGRDRGTAHPGRRRPARRRRRVRTHGTAARGRRLLPVRPAGPRPARRAGGRTAHRAVGAGERAWRRAAAPVVPVDDVAWPPPEVWDDIIDLNVSAAYRLTRALAGRLAPGAAVCNVSSIAAAMPWAVSPAYGAAKAALEHWSSSLAVLLAPRAVRVNLVRPGFVWSRQWAAVDRAEFERVVADRVVLREAPPHTSREQTAADIAAAVAFLCSADARHVTGQAINVDGGATLVRAAR